MKNTVDTGIISPCCLIIVLTIYALDFLAAPYIIIFLSANGLQGPFEGPVPKNPDFFGYKPSECHFGAKKVEIFRDRPFK